MKSNVKAGALPAKKRKKVSEGSVLAQRTFSEHIVFGIVFAIFCLHSFMLIFPTLWMVMTSLKDGWEYMIGNPFDLPEQLKFVNYIDAFKVLNTTNANFAEMIFNSVWYTFIVTALGSLIPAITGYCLSKYHFAARQIIFTLAIVSMTMPIVGSGAAFMKLIGFLQIYDTPLYPIVCNLGGFGGAFLVYYGFFKSVSWNYAEAAMMDGANPFTVFFRIMLPMAKPVILTYAITGAIGTWNDFSTMILYLPSYPTLASGLYLYVGGNDMSMRIPVYFAGLIISMVPTLALFCACSSKIMTSISFGGLKG